MNQKEAAGDLLHKAAIVRHKNDRPRRSEQIIFQHFNALHIDMIRGLIQYHQRRLQEFQGQKVQTCLLTATEGADGDMVTMMGKPGPNQLGTNTLRRLCTVLHNVLEGRVVRLEGAQLLIVVAEYGAWMQLHPDSWSILEGRTIACRKVVLPAPLRPRMAILSPGLTAKSSTQNSSFPSPTVT